jgi:hypothetical protein
LARLVLGAGNRRLDALVFGLQHLIADRIVLDEILDIGVGQDRLLDRIELLRNLGALVQSLLDRFLGDHHLQRQLIDDGCPGFRRIRAA